MSLYILYVVLGCLVLELETSQGVLGSPFSRYSDAETKTTACDVMAP
jgi:hypothetical protein